MSDAWPFGDLRPHSYGLILADPPWRFETRSETNQKKSAARHYELMGRGELFRLPVWRLAAPNCALLLWATQAQLPLAIDLLKAWGFDYRSAGAWAKQSSSGASWAFGTGYWFRSAAEFYVAGAIGHPAIKSKSERNLIVAPTREHSRKPDEMQAMLERMFPDTRKVELFARERREGWDCWGDEVDKFSTEAA